MLNQHLAENSSRIRKLPLLDFAARHVHFSVQKLCCDQSHRNRAVQGIPVIVNSLKILIANLKQLQKIRLNNYLDKIFEKYTETCDIRDFNMLILGNYTFQDKV